jgi:hypothetical protein
VKFEYSRKQSGIASTRAGHRPIKRKSCSMQSRSSVRRLLVPFASWSVKRVPDLGGFGVPVLHGCSIEVCAMSIRGSRTARRDRDRGRESRQVLQSRAISPDP